MEARARSESRFHGFADGPQRRADLRDYLAAERTFLAWIRTGLALMGFGFVVARFGLFLQEISGAQHVLATQSSGLSLWFGTALIGAGVAVNLVSGWKHARLIRELDRGESEHARPLGPAVAIACFLAMAGLAMAAYLVSVRGSAHTQSERKEGGFMTPSIDNGIVNKLGVHSVEYTVARIEAILKTKGVTLFALIDHSGEAEKAGMKMLPTKLLIFGNPKAGTPLMLASPSSAIDLPLKILVWEDSHGQVWVSYNSPQYLQARHRLSRELLPAMAVVETLAAEAAE